MSKAPAVAAPHSTSDEFNPFLSMAQLFNTAADHLGLDEGLRQVLQLRAGGATVTDLLKDPATGATRSLEQALAPLYGSSPAQTP